MGSFDLDKEQSNFDLNKEDNTSLENEHPKISAKLTLWFMIEEDGFETVKYDEFNVKDKIACIRWLAQRNFMPHKNELQEYLKKQ